MRWHRFTIHTTSEAEDILVSALSDIGIEGVEIVDSQPLSEEDKEQMFVDIMPEMPSDDGKACLNFYLEEDANVPKILDQVKSVLAKTASYIDIGEGRIEQSQTEDKDWINNWKEYFHQFHVDDILIVPSWENIPEEDTSSLVLHIDPGTAFGTGMHETTQLVIRQLKKRVKPGHVLLDVGTGSGILGILACKLGAARVYGTDLDPCAVNAVRENLEANSVAEESFTLRIGNIIDDPAIQQEAGREQYDLVTANILADVLVALAPVIPSFMKKGGYFITSGILEGKQQEVAQAMEQAGLAIEEITRQGEWYCVTGRK